MTLLNWKGNVAKVGGVEFEIEQYGLAYKIRVKITGLTLYPDHIYHATESEARAAAEEIAKAIFDGAPVVRKRVRNFGDPEFFRESGVEQPEYWQRGIWVPLEGE